MSLLSTKKKNLLWLFICGFFIGICLEILLIGRGKLNLVHEHDPLKNYLRITCMVLIKHDHMRFVNSSRKTWLKHCDEHHIVKVRRLTNNLNKIQSKNTSSSSGNFQSLLGTYTTCTETNDLKEIEAKNAWNGLCKAFHLIKPTNSHWLVIAPDSLIVLVENLKLFVKSLNYEDNHYYGYTIQNYEADFNVLSAGILLSRGTLKRLLKKFVSEKDCDLSGKYWKNEDFYLGKYLKDLNILPTDSRDEEGRGRFHGYNMNNILWPGKLFNKSDYKRKSLFPVSQGFNCCSPWLITVDVSDPDSLQTLYFLFYKLRTSHKKLPDTITIKYEEGIYWKEFLREQGYNETEMQNMTDEEYYKIWEKKLPLNVMYNSAKNFLKKDQNKFNKKK